MRLVWFIGWILLSLPSCSKSKPPPAPILTRAISVLYSGKTLAPVVVGPTAQTLTLLCATQPAPYGVVVTGGGTTEISLECGKANLLSLEIVLNGDLVVATTSQMRDGSKVQLAKIEGVKSIELIPPQVARTPAKPEVFAVFVDGNSVDIDTNKLAATPVDRAPRLGVPLRAAFAAQGIDLSRFARLIAVDGSEPPAKVELTRAQMNSDGMQIGLHLSKGGHWKLNVEENGASFGSIRGLRRIDLLSR